MLIKYIDISNLVGSKQHLPFIMPAVPVIMVCFGSHFVIPSLRGYLNSDEKIKNSNIDWQSDPFIYLYLLGNRVPGSFISIWGQ